MPEPARVNPIEYGAVSSRGGARDVLLFFIRPLENHRLTRAIYLRGLGVIYLCAFVSLWVQIDGLIGSRGILPARDYLAQAASQVSQRFLDIPTLCWLNDSDAFLHFLCGGGAALSILLILGIAPIPVLILLYLFYLSLAQVGQVFLGYQWDALLLEAGFLAIFFAPWSLRPRLTASPGPSPIVLFLQRWLVFRLMFLSGLVKALSGDPTWLKLHAMQFHYFTQPLPTWTAWYMAQLPQRFQALSVVVVFVAELGVPLLFFWPRRARLIGFWATVAFQILILATGNFGFFNLLAIVLCVPLMDDRFWMKFLPRLVKRHPESAPASPRRFSSLHWPLAVTAPLCGVLFLCTLLSGIQRLRLSFFDGAGPIQDVYRRMSAVANYVQRFEVANAYGLFEEMTTARPEIIVQGSDDGVTWKTYPFKWKPGDVDRRPRFCIPHMPRLDWQMWFAAVYMQYQQPPYWFRSFLVRLLQGSPPVLDLLQDNPFPDHPPKYVRALVYDYHFTSRAFPSPAWWQRTETGEYQSPVRLEQGMHLMYAEPGIR